MIKDWFKEYVEGGYGRPYVGEGHEFIIYKGFKIVSFESQAYFIFDVRRSDFYTKVSTIDLEFFKEHGFIKGADLIMHNRDTRRVSKYNDLLEHWYAKRDILLSKKKELDPKKFKRDMYTIQRNISDFIDKLFFYQSRKSQTENKYSNQLAA